MNRLLLILVTLLAAATMQARQVSVDRAKGIALQLVQTRSVAKKANASNKAGGPTLELVYTATAANAIATRAASGTNSLFYIFNQSDNSGFVIVAADDAVSPILAYSHQNSFRADNMPCNVKAVLDDYRSAITAAIAEGKDASSEWTSIAKAAEASTEGDYLVKSQWNQGYPYNAQTPILAEDHCVTGCVATAMAQIMYYWKYPEAGTGTHEYYWAGGDKMLSADFSKPIDWANMHDTYDYDTAYTQKEVDAISHLLLQCGISVDMNYYNSSGASTTTMREALCKYFGYSYHMACSYSLSEVSETEWMRIIKEEIDNGRPIVYTSNNHAYICDGYDAGDYLHINFGWGGYSDGFYQFMGTNEYLNRSYQEIVCGLMPGEKAPYASDGVKTKRFVCENDDGNVASGTNLKFQITFNSSEIADIDAVTVVRVDKDNNLLENVAITHYSSMSDERCYAECCANNLYNDNEGDAEYIFMPAYKVAGEWNVATDATPIVKSIAQMTSCSATNLYMAFPINRKSMPVGETNRAGVFITPLDDNFKGVVEMAVSNEASETVYTQTSHVTLAQGVSNYIPVDYIFLESGNYAFSVAARDATGAKVKSASTEIQVYEETYLTGFAYDLSKYGKVAGLYPDFMVFTPNTTVHLKASFHNPTNQPATKTYAVANQSNRYESITASNVASEKTVTIPAKGDANIYFDVTANPVGTNSNVHFTLVEKQDDGSYESPNTDRTATSVPRSNIYYTLETPQMIFSKAPTVSGEDALTLHANQEAWMTLYLQVQDAGLSQTVGYMLIARLYDGDNKVGEYKGTINSIYDYQFQWLIGGFDVSPGTYTLKFALDQMGTEYEIADASGDVAAYTVEVKAPDLLPEQSRILNGADDYRFSAVNSILHKWGKTKLKFALTNPHSTKFVGKIKVMEYTHVTPCIVSEEKSVTINGNNSENVYGEISVTVPSDYGYTGITCKLFAKSQYDDYYRAIGGASFYATISNTNAIGSLTAGNGVTIAAGGEVIADGEVTDVHVYDLSGRIVSGYTVSGNTIDLRPLPRGVYMVRANTGGGEPLMVKVAR